jgi:flagellar biosynthetic protein FlhB
MAQDPSRTEKATAKRRDKAQNEGNLLRVMDLDACVMLWGAFFLFVAMGGSTLLLVAHAMRHFLERATLPGQLVQENLQALALDVFQIVLRIILPFLMGMFGIAIANQFLQHGFHLKGKPLMPNFGKLNPVNGFKKLFSARAVIEVFKSLAKFAILTAVAYSVLGSRIPIILASNKLPLNHALLYMEETLFILFRNVMLAMLAIAAFDFFYQRHAFEKGLMMTKQEVKDEQKDVEGNAQVKGRQKSLMFSAMVRRIRTQVPKASVVITNPTHFAVALRYDEQTAAPVCVAKGADHLAKQIRELAKESGVTVVENPPLARALYWTVDVDRQIPPELYQAVAQVLAFVYRLKGAA